jgi:hypothetical protein
MQSERLAGHLHIRSVELNGHSGHDLAYLGSFGQLPQSSSLADGDISHNQHCIPPRLPFTICSMLCNYISNYKSHRCACSSSPSCSCSPAAKTNARSTSNRWLNSSPPTEPHVPLVLASYPLSARLRNLLWQDDGRSGPSRFLQQIRTIPILHRINCRRAR